MDLEPQTQTCDSTEHRCGDGRCVPRHFLCDGDDDCQDRSDELNCSCDLTEHRCGDGRCVPRHYLCDGDDDCQDRSDELNCWCDANYQHRCGDGRCVPRHFLCDGDNDCQDRSDELNCSCDPTEHRCGNGRCVPRRFQCDGDDDCQDRSDELNCSCDPTEHRCGDGRCVPRHLLCDGDDDCQDRSDELNCFHMTTKAGDNVTLPCRAPTGVQAVEWIRADLKPERVFWYQDGQSSPDEQHPAYVNRVELKNHKIKDGDVSVILQDVNFNDKGTFVCRIVHNGTKLSITFIRLKVSPGPVNITSEPSETVLLPCQNDHGNIWMRNVRLIRRDLDPENVFVFLSIDSLFMDLLTSYSEDDQHVSFRGRVELEGKMNETLYIRLENVTTNDTGTYECYIDHEVRHMIGEPQLSGIIHLDVRPSVQVKITAYAGDIVSLPCHVPKTQPVSSLEWIRRDLESKSVFLYQHEWSDPNQQHPLFTNRVELESRMGDDDVFLILKDVRINDSGLYECRVIHLDTSHRTSIISLDVNPANPEPSVLRIVLHLLVLCPYFVSTLLMVSLYGRRPLGRNESVLMAASPSYPDEGSDYIMVDAVNEHHF